MMAGRFPVYYASFDGAAAVGPVPTFFSSNPEEATRQLSQDPEYAFECLQALVSKLLARRELTREEAEAYYMDPREGDFRRQLKRPWTSPTKTPKTTSEGKGMKHLKTQMNTVAKIH